MGYEASLVPSEEYFLDELERAKGPRDVSNVKLIVDLAQA